MIVLLASAIFVVGYALFSLEYIVKIDKSAVALAAGSLLWLLIAVTQPAQAFVEAISGVGANAFDIVMFLLASMTLAEVLAHYRFFDLIRAKIHARKLSDRTEFWLVSGTTFCLSMILNNLTTTIAMLYLARLFFREKNLLVATVAVVISANASVFSPLGDVTTLMLWISHKVSGTHLVSQLFLPSLLLFGVSNWILSRRIHEDTPDEEIRDFVAPSRSEGAIIFLTLGALLLPFLFTRLGLPAYLGVTSGLALVWMVSDLFRAADPRQSHLSADIEKFLQRADISTLKFLVGILLSIGALEHLGVLTSVTHAVFGEHPADARLIVGSIITGLASAVIDNVPLTAAGIHALAMTDQGLWALFALAVGTGGSLLAIGSGAGIIAMGSASELTFFQYIKLATFPAFAGYATAIAVWLLQRAILS